QAYHGETHCGEVAECAQAFDAGLQILDFRYGKRGVFFAPALRALPDIDQTVLVAVDERLKQDPAHHGEDGGIGAYAQRQREDDGDGKPSGALEGVVGKSQIAEESHTLILSIAEGVRTHFKIPLELKLQRLGRSAPPSGPSPHHAQPRKTACAGAPELRASLRQRGKKLFCIAVYAASRAARHDSQPSFATRTQANAQVMP